MTALSLKQLGARLRQAFSVRELLEALLASFGLLWLAVETTSFFSDLAAEWLGEQGWWFLLLGLAYAVWRAWPKLHISHRLSGRDTRIEIRIADIFSLNGAMVITTNSTFETDEHIIAEDSLQGQFRNLYYDSPKHLAQDLSESLQYSTYDEIDRDGRQLRKYPLGTVAKINAKGRTAYFIALTELNAYGNASGSFEDLQRCLPLLWEFVAARGQTGPLLMPVLGTGRARLAQSREQIIREIIQSYAAACSSRRFCEALVIVVSPSDFVKHQVNLVELDMFVRHTCLYSLVSEQDQTRTGTGIER